MRNALLGGAVLASALAIAASSAPALAQFRDAGAAPDLYRLHGAYHRHRSYGGDHGGFAAGAALATGALIGGAIASQNYDAGAYPDPDYGPGPVYGEEDPGYIEVAPQVADEGDTTAYCERTFRSYDPASGTYLGYDGIRHPCP
jgi:hypothetical protein